MLARNLPMRPPIARDPTPPRRRRPTLASLLEARGQVLGHPRLSEARVVVQSRLRASAEAHAAATMPAIYEARIAGAKSLRQIAAALNGRGIATARSARWEAATVRNMLKR